MALAFSDFGDVEAVLAVGVDLFESCRAEVGDGVVVDLVSVGSFGVDGVLEVGGGGQDAGVGDEAEAVGLHGLVFVVAVADFLAVGEGDEVAEVVEGFASVELTADSAAERFVGEPAKRVGGSDQFPVFEERLCQRVLAAAGLEPG